MKKSLALLICISLLFTLTACGDKTPEASTASSVISESVSESISESVPASISEEDVLYTEEPLPEPELPTLEDTINMYADFIKSVYDSDPVSMNNLRYGLVYADSDAIPELVYMEDNYHAATVHMCMASPDGVWELGEFGEYGSFAYIPRMGRVLSFFMNQGTYFYDFYNIEKRTLQEDIYFEVDESGYMDDECHYYVDGDEVDSDTYTAAYNRAYGYGFETMEYYDAVSYEESYDVKDILTKWTEIGTRPPSILIDDDLVAAAGEYGAVTVTFEDGVVRDSAEEEFAAAVSLLPDGVLSLWISYNDELITDYAMSVDYYKKSDPAYGGLWTIGARNEDNCREYFFTLYDGGKCVLNVSDSLNTIGHTTYSVEGQFVTYDED